MKPAKFKVEGLAELDRQLGRLGKATGKAVLRRVAKRALEPMAAAAKSAAPRDAGDMADSIHVGTKVSGPDASKAAFADVMRSGGSRADAVAALRSVRRATASSVWMHMGPGRHPQAITQEFGTFFHPAQPFMRTAWNSGKMAMLERIKDDLAADIERTIQRVERRRARAGSA